MTIAVIRQATFLASLLCSVGGAALADTELTFGAGLRLQSESNPDLTPGGSAQSTTGGVDLSFGLISETALSTLSLQTSARLLDVDGSGHVAWGLTDPALSLSYARTTANAKATLDAGLTDTDVAGGDVTNFDTGSGKRRTATLSAGLAFGTAGPLGFGLTAGVTDIHYHDNPGPGLTDSRTARLGTTLRSDLSQVLHLNLGLNARRFDQDGKASRDTQGLDLGLTLDRPTGALSLRFTGDHTPDGQRLGLTFEHQMTLAAGTLTYSVGATRGVSDKTYATGAVSYAQDLANGAISLALARTVQPGAETDAESVVSNSSLTYQRAMTPRANLALALNWAEQRNTATDLATANTNLSATWTQNVTEDWALDLGYTHRMRDQDGVGQGQSDLVFLAFRRSFTRRF